jgi:hypothetical protein
MVKLLIELTEWSVTIVKVWLYYCCILLVIVPYLQLSFVLSFYRNLNHLWIANVNIAVWEQYLSWRYLIGWDCILHASTYSALIVLPWDEHSGALPRGGLYDWFVHLIKRRVKLFVFVCNHWRVTTGVSRGSPSLVSFMTLFEKSRHNYPVFGSPPCRKLDRTTFLCTVLEKKLSFDSHIRFIKKRNKPAYSKISVS